MICFITVPSRGEIPHVNNLISTGQSVQLRKAYYRTVCISTIIGLYAFQPVKLASCRISCQVANLATYAMNACNISLGKFPNAIL